MDGYEDSTFRPEQNVSRAEFVKMTVTAMKLPLNPPTAGDSWYTPYINAAVTAGIHHWDDFTTGDWNTPISRLEMSRVAVRATKKELQNPAMHMDDNSFMYNATKSGLIQGLARGELGLNQATTRAQSVTIIERILTVNSGGKLDLDKYAVSSAELSLKKTNIFSVAPDIFGGDQVQGDEWNPSKLVEETPDGKFKGELDQLVAIDLDDPNDPNLGLLPDINTLYWFSHKDRYPVKDWPHSYILVVKSHVDYNNDTTIYSDYKFLPFSVIGIDSPDQNAFFDGKLNSLASISLPKGSSYKAYIIPKKGFVSSGQITLTINAPAFPPNNIYNKVILNVVSPKLH